MAPRLLKNFHCDNEVHFNAETYLDGKQHSQLLFVGLRMSLWRDILVFNIKGNINYIALQCIKQYIIDIYLWMIIYLNTTLN